jgi:hypothetical protein
MAKIKSAHAFSSRGLEVKPFLSRLELRSVIASRSDFSTNNEITKNRGFIHKSFIIAHLLPWGDLPTEQFSNYPQSISKHYPYHRPCLPYKVTNQLKCPSAITELVISSSGLMKGTGKHVITN